MNHTPDYYIVDLNDPELKDALAGKVIPVYGGDYALARKVIDVSIAVMDAEKNGAEKAWNMMRDIHSMSGMCYSFCFGNAKDPFHLSYEEAAEKYEAGRKKWLEWMDPQDKIKVGDEVQDKEGNVYFITYVNKEKDEDGERLVTGIDRDGMSHCDWAGHISKTGKHSPEVAVLLKKIGADNVD